MRATQNGSATPVNIEGLFQPIIPGSAAQRVDIEGKVGNPDTHDGFSFNLAAGQSLSAVLYSSGLSSSVPLSIKSSAGTLMATSNSTGVGQVTVLSDFIAPIADTYTLSFDYTSSNRNYTLILTRDAGIEVESNTSIATPNLNRLWVCGSGR